MTSINTSTDIPSAPRPARRSRATAPRPGTDAGGAAGEWSVCSVIESDAGGRLMVRSGKSALTASRALSCLLQPEVDDDVACLRAATGELWVLAVLRRESRATQVLRFDGDMRLEVAGGGFSVGASSISLDAASIEARTGNATLSADCADVVGRQVTLVASHLKLVGSVLSSVMDRVQHFSKHYLRRTDGLDRVSAAHVDVQSDAVLRLEGEHALVQGRELIKARGAQIHFG